ncbi:MAG: type II toxin-antitoxin system RelE/ParE family toxin [Steroidobacteraceae bacterium]
MAEVIWTEPASGDIEAIADYIALDNPIAAKAFFRRVSEHVDQLADHPLSGSKLPEFKGWHYRQIVEPPCRVIYRHEKGRVHILHVVRGERLLDQALLAVRNRSTDT